MNKLLLSAAVFVACASRPPLNVDGILTPAPVNARLQAVGQTFGPYHFYDDGATKNITATPAGNFNLTVRAYADTANGLQPKMILRIGAMAVDSVTVRRVVKDYSFNLIGTGEMLSIAFAGDWYDPVLGDVNLHIETVTLSDTGTDIRLFWDANTELDLAGYKVYFGIASRTYEDPDEVGLNTSYSLASFRDGVTRYFSVTAYDTAGNESDYSNEVIWTAPVPADTVESDSSLVEWPDTKPLKMRIVYQKRDATGKPLVPVIRLEMEKYDAGNSYGWFQKFPGADFTLTAADDTTSIIEMNMPTLASSIAREGEKYLWNIRFRVRLENPADQAKVTSWVYADKSLHLFQAVNPLEGVPVAPTFKIIL